jgi:RHS repeat-associated protein
MYDRETNLHYNYFRDYDPQTGRYVQSDPIGLRGGLNGFSYANSAPISFTDMFGLYTEIIQWAGDGSRAGAWGHISGNINGENHSWGPGGWDQSRPAAVEYALRQTLDVGREGSGVVLNLTPVEEARLVACIRRDRGSYNAIKNNCGNPWLTCLEQQGLLNIGNKRRVLPMDVLEAIRGSSRAEGVTTYSTAGGNTFDVPAASPFINHVRKKLGL